MRTSLHKCIDHLHVKSFKGTVRGALYGIELRGLKAALNERSADKLLTSQLELFANHVMNGRIPVQQQLRMQENRSVPTWHSDKSEIDFWPFSKQSDDLSSTAQKLLPIHALQYLQPVAALAFMKNDIALTSLCISHVLDWISKTKPMRGVAWSSIDIVSLRCISLVYVLTLCGDGLSKSEKVMAYDSLYRHGYWLSRYGISHHNVISKSLAALALYMLDSAVPETIQSDRWLQQGYSTLTNITQYFDENGLPNGINMGDVPCLFEIMMLALFTSQQNNKPLPNHWIANTLEIANRLRECVNSNVWLPRFGDVQAMHIIQTGISETDYVASLLTCAGSYSFDQTLVPPSPPKNLRTILFTLPPQPLALPDMAKSFDGGISVVREDMGDSRMTMHFLHGLKTDHQDSLSVHLSVDGIPIFGDAGFHAEKLTPYWPLPVAHSGLEINAGLLESSTLVNHNHDIGNWSFRAEKQYQRAAHTRHIEKTGRGFKIIDTVSQSSDVKIHFLLHPDIQPVHHKNGWLMVGHTGPMCRIKTDGSLPHAIDHGRHDPIMGWACLDGHTLRKTFCLSFCGNLPKSGQHIVEVIFD